MEERVRLRHARCTLLQRGGLLSQAIKNSHRRGLDMEGKEEGGGGTDGLGPELNFSYMSFSSVLGGNYTKQQVLI